MMVFHRYWYASVLYLLILLPYTIGFRPLYALPPLHHRPCFRTRQLQDVLVLRQFPRCTTFERSYVPHRKHLFQLARKEGVLEVERATSLSGFDHFEEALLTYKALHGDLKVSAAYSISQDDTRYPERVRGMKLGRVAQSIRNLGTYADHREKLVAMGFLFDSQMSTFAEVQEALVTYKALYGDLKVPAAYIIAEDDVRYPERVRGMKLGTVVKNIRHKGTYADQREELVAMGVLFDRQRARSTFAEVKEALVTYKELYGDLKIPRSYIIAEDDVRYSERVRGIKLGTVVQSIRNQGTYSDHREELEAMGFLFDRPKRVSTFAEVKEALLTYKALHGDLKVPAAYIIAEDDVRYSERVRGMKLGSVLSKIRNLGTYADHREELAAMGFLFDRQIRVSTFAEVQEALLVYQALHGDLKVPQSYIIAQDDIQYPERVRGMNLGRVVSKIRNEGTYADHREELEAMGFLFDQQIRVSTFAEVKEAFLTYKALYGDLKVPRSFIIADDDIQYPERVRGMKLGSVVSNIRNHGYYADEREELVAMGFLFDQQKRVSTFAEVQEALLTYKTLHGDLKVPQSYIISEDDIRYPERVRGMKLGKVVSSIRNKGTYADHREELEAMGFLFDRQVSTFAEVKEALLTYKALYGDLKVPVAYIIAEDDVGYPVRVRGMKLGGVVKNIRNLGTYADHREELEAMGFLFDRQVSTFAEVKEALLTYKALHGDLKVPVAYIIAEDDVRYPERVRGMKLGNIVNGIRNVGSYADHREELVAMGFLYVVDKRPSLKSK